MVKPSILKSLVKKLIFQDKHVRGSPFRFEIEVYDDGYQKVRAAGEGLTSGLVGRPGRSEGLRDLIC